MFVSGYAISTIDAFCFAIDLRTEYYSHFEFAASVSRATITQVFSINKIYMFLIIGTLWILLAYPNARRSWFKSKWQIDSMLETFNKFVFCFATVAIAI